MQMLEEQVYKLTRASVLTGVAPTKACLSDIGPAEDDLLEIV
jgi:hypothetical protein